MKINEVEAAVGVTKKNIRFYEEEGLISPSREPGNGYRSYSQADVERLRRIKLLRKLDVPLAEIREMLEGQCTLAEGMSLQLERLRSRRADLEEAIGFCTLLQQENGPLEQLDVEQTLARLTAREEQGVTFVNIERTDQKTRRIRGACIGAALFVAMMAFIMATMGWAVYTDPQDAPPLPLLVVMFGIPAGCCADGPSGIRMDCGTHAFSLPNGTSLACTFHEELVEKLFEKEGLELRRNRVDLLLDPV